MLEHKNYIYAIYEERSFSKAAQKLFVSQPWLSAVVKKTEQKLKTPLFDRSTTPISLTPAGEQYIRYAEQIMAIEEEMNQYFSTLYSEKGQALHIGTSMFFCTYVLPRLMSQFRKQYPDITLTFSEGDAAALQDQLTGKKLDFVLEVEQLHSPQLRSIPWEKEEIVLAVPAKFPINQELAPYRYTFDELLKRNEPGQKKPPVDLRLFADQPFLMLKPGNDIHDRAVSICQDAGLTPKIAMYLTQMMTAYYLTCEGTGVSFIRSTIPEYVSPTDSVFFYQLDHPKATRTIYLSYQNRKLNPVQQKLMDFMGQKALPTDLL